MSNQNLKPNPVARLGQIGIYSVFGIAIDSNIVYFTLHIEYPNPSLFILNTFFYTNPRQTYPKCKSSLKKKYDKDSTGFDKYYGTSV